jgi:hypothetical protein
LRTEERERERGRVALLFSREGMLLELLHREFQNVRVTNLVKRIQNISEGGFKSERKE